MLTKDLARGTRRWARDLSLTAFAAAILALIYYAAYWIRFEGRIEPSYATALTQTLAAVTLLKTAAFVWFRAHRGWRRMATFYDFVLVAQAATLGTCLIVFADHLWFTQLNVPRGVVVIDWGGTLIVFCGLRGMSRFVQENSRSIFIRRSDERRALIVGVNSAAENLLRVVRANVHPRFRVVGFVDHGDRHLGDVIAGVPVVGSLNRLSETIRRHGADELLISAGELSGPRVREIITQCETLGVHVSMLPSYAQLLSGQVEFKAREISIDDLLRRQPVNLDTEQIRGWLQSRVLMVTGSAGSIGSEICRQLLQFGPARIVLVDRWENGQYELERQLKELSRSVPIDVCMADISDTRRMERLFAEFQPEVLFHAAAYKHVPLMERNPGEGVKNIAQATRRLADLADEFGLQAFVLISTDKAVNPTSVMGTCKRVAELYVQSLAERSSCRFVTVRFGNVLGSNGSVVPLFREQIAAGGPVTITDFRMQRFFMTIPEAAQLVIQAGAMGQGGEIFVLDMGEPIRIIDLAHDMIRLSGLRVGHDIEIEEVGLRPGEKLFEELNVHGEVHQPTHHSKIRIAMRTSSLTAAEIAAAVDQLCRSADEPAGRIIEQLTTLVPEYRPDLMEVGGLRLFSPTTDATEDGKPKAA